MIGVWLSSSASRETYQRWVRLIVFVIESYTIVENKWTIIMKSIRSNFGLKFVVVLCLSKIVVCDEWPN